MRTRAWWLAFLLLAVLLPVWAVGAQLPATPASSPPGTRTVAEMPPRLAGAGSVRGWGLNESGVIVPGRPGSDLAAHLPSKIDGLENIVQVAAGQLRAAAVEADGSLWVWGGPGALSLTRVAGLDAVTTVTLGYTITARRADGTLWQLNPTNAPVRVTGIDNVTTHIEYARELVVVKGDGTVWCCRPGQWTQIPGIDAVRAVAVLDDANPKYNATLLALKANGTVWREETRGHWVEITGLAGSTTLSHPFSSTPLAIKRDGTAWAIQTDTNAVPLPSRSAQTPPRPIAARQILADIPDIVAVATNHDEARTDADYTLVLRRDGTVWAAGSNRWGTLGLRQAPDMCAGDVPCAQRPVRIPGLHNIKAIAAGDKFALAVIGG